MPPPVPGHDHGGLRAAARWGCGCFYMYDHATGEWLRAIHCGRTDFNLAEWEAKLPGPRDGESLAEYERRIEP